MPPQPMRENRSSEPDSRVPESFSADLDTDTVQSTPVRPARQTRSSQTDRVTCTCIMDYENCKISHGYEIPVKNQSIIFYKEEHLTEENTVLCMVEPC